MQAVCLFLLLPCLTALVAAELGFLVVVAGAGVGSPPPPPLLPPPFSTSARIWEEEKEVETPQQMHNSDSDTYIFSQTRNLNGLLWLRMEFILPLV